MSEQSGRGEQTRRLIVDTAVRLFGELGYEKTTMRAIAAAAGVSVGNAYYYFPSKDALVREFYLQLQREQVAAIEPVLAAGGDFGDQLRGVLTAALATWEPHHEFAGKFAGLAAVPHSPVSPFSTEATESKSVSMGIFARLVEQTTVKMDPALRKELPELLWTCQLGLLFYWAHDDSPGRRRTHAVVNLAVPYVEYLVTLSRLKPLRPVTERGLALLRLIRRG